MMRFPMSDISLLILEDSPADAELMVRQLSEDGLAARWRLVDNRKAFLEALEEKTDVILADWSLQGFSGLEALMLLKETGLDIPFIVVTESMGEEAAVETMRAGAYDLVLKERLVRLPASVRRAVEESRIRAEKERAEMALRERDRRFRDIFDSLQDALFILDPEGRVIEANETAYIGLSYSRAELLGMTTLEIDAEGNAEMVPQRLQRIRQEGSLIFETLHRRKDGSVFPVEVHCKVFEYEGSKAILSIARDISERRRLEQEILEGKHDLAYLIDSIEGMVYSCRNDENWTMTFVSHGCLALTGYKSNELLHNRVVAYNDLIHPDDRRYVWDTVQEAIGEKRPYLLEYRIISKDGQTKWVWEKGRGVFDRHGDLVSLEGIISDITDKKLAEAERERLFTAVEQAGEAIFITDRDGAIVYANPAFERITGYSGDEALGKNPRILKSGKQDKAFYKALWDTITGGRTWKGRLINRRKDGTLYTEDATISPVLDRSGRVMNYLAVKRDITAQLELEERFNQAQKMESIGRLAGGVAHDFNNMLGVIIGHAELALEDPAISPSLASALKEILKAADRSANLTRQLLGFARKQTISPKVIDLNETVEGMLKMLRRIIGENISLAWRPSSGLWPVKMDSSQVDQILANLCVNARDAIGSGGSISIATANHSFDEAFCRSNKGFSPGDYVGLAVSDDGCGMDKSTMEKIFEPFFTTKAVGEGTGLGLATVYGIVRQNNGFIRVESQPGEGATFEIYIPRHEGKKAEEIEEKAIEPQGGTGGTVLVVEDDPSLLLLISKVLKTAGYKVLEAPSPEQALGLAGSHREPIDLLVSDVVMPGMDGKALAERILEKRPRMKVLFLSGYPADFIAGQGWLDDGTAFLSKPFTPRALAAKVRELLKTDGKTKEPSQGE
jgi:PAS domain S-box-containing protein